MKKKKRRNSAQASAETSAKNRVSELDLGFFSAAKFRLPVEGTEPIRIATSAEHALFLRCWEAFRVVDLFNREIPRLVERYSKYNERTQFATALKVNPLNSDSKLAAESDPEAMALSNLLLGMLHDLNVDLAMTEVLPFTLKQELEDRVALMSQVWERLRSRLLEKHGWNFRGITA